MYICVCGSVLQCVAVCCSVLQMCKQDSSSPSCEGTFLIGITECMCFCDFSLYRFFFLSSL